MQNQAQAIQNEESLASIQQQRSSTINQTAHPEQKPESNAEQFRASTIRQQQQQRAMQNQANLASIQLQRRGIVRQSLINAPTPTRARPPIPVQIRQQQRQAMQNQA